MRYSISNGVMAGFCATVAKSMSGAVSTVSSRIVHNVGAAISHLDPSYVLNGGLHDLSGFGFVAFSLWLSCVTGQKILGLPGRACKSVAFTAAMVSMLGSTYVLEHYVAPALHQFQARHRVARSNTPLVKPSRPTDTDKTGHQKSETSGGKLLIRASSLSDARFEPV